MTERNWAGNYAYRAERIHRPTSLEEVASIVASAPQVRVLGSRHSFTDIADAPLLLSLAELPADVIVDRDASTVSFGAGLTYGQLAAISTRGRARAGEPRLAAAHLGRWRRRHRHAPDPASPIATWPTPSPASS